MNGEKLEKLLVVISLKPLTKNYENVLSLFLRASRFRFRVLEKRLWYICFFTHLEVV